MPNEIGTYLEKYFSSVEEPISELVSSDAIACVGEYSQGISKRINTLFDVAVLTAKLDGNSRITREIVEKAKDRCKFSSITVESGGSTHGSNRKPELHTKKPTKRLA